MIILSKVIIPSFDPCCIDVLKRSHLGCIKGLYSLKILLLLDDSILNVTICGTPELGMTPKEAAIKWHCN